jgi:hypothetical protein
VALAASPFPLRWLPPELFSIALDVDASLDLAESVAARRFSSEMERLSSKELVIPYDFVHLKHIY